MTDTTEHRSRPLADRLFGGNPFGVVLRLVILSLIVGFLMHTFGINVQGLIRGAVDLVRDTLRGGFRELRYIGGYILTGAAVVVPIWLVLRLTRAR